MGNEIDLLKNYPKAKRNLEARSKKTESDRKVARDLGKEFLMVIENMGMVVIHITQNFGLKR